MSSYLYFASAAFLIACASEERPNGPGRDGPIGPGGTGGVDAAVTYDADPSAGTLNGRLCVVVDMRKSAACTLAEDLPELTLSFAGGASTQSSADGTFTLPWPKDTEATLLVTPQTDDGFRTSAIVLSPADDGVTERLIPIVPESLWTELLFDLSVVEPDGTATVAVYLDSETGAPLAGKEIVPPTGSASAPFYAGPGGPSDWALGRGTDGYGAALLFGLPIGQGTTSFVVLGGTEPQDVTDVPVYADTLTFLRVVVL